MPGIVKVKVLEGRNLPVMDKSADTTDAYVEIKLGNSTFKTDVCRKSLNPQWNSEWYKFEMDDAELQDEPLQVRLMDHDTYSANDMIGKVYFNLNPLLLNTCTEARDNLLKSSHSSSPGSGCISGWFPVYDTIHGLRGEINLIIKLELFSDFNKFRQSSCGIHVFSCSMIPYGYYTEHIYGFVEELVVEDDPEYQWIEKIRTPRASNEARQAMFYKMSGEVQRKIGLKVIELGGNAVIGYRQYFDLEGETGAVVVRGIGTAVKLNRTKQFDTQNRMSNAEPVFDEPIPILPAPSDVRYNNGDDIASNNENNLGVEITTADMICNISPEALTPSCLLMHANNLDRNVSDCDKELDDGSTNLTKRESVPPADPLTKKRPSLPDTSVFTKVTDTKDNVPADNEVSSISKPSINQGANIIHKENLDLMEYPFLTLSIYPEDFILHLGGTVSARSVKLLARISNIEEPETRDAWWTELRIEIKSHMRALACNVVLNYIEYTSICDEVCVLSACGTAALVKIYDGSTSSLMENFSMKNPASKSIDLENENKERLPSVSERASCEEINCSMYHIPYRKSSLPLPVKIRSCGICKKGFVADVVFVTIEPFDKMPVIGQGAFIHAFVYRLKRDCKSELNAREISDGLPFLEYELNRQLVNKLRIKGMNALFGLNVQVAIGEKMISAYATGTAVLLAVLPAPPELTVSMGRPLTQQSASKKKLTDARKLLEDTIKKNRIHYQLGDFHNISDGGTKSQSVSTDASQDPQYPDLEYFAGSKQTCAIEVDDEEDLEIIAQLIDPNPPQGFLVSSTEKLIFGSLPYVPKKNIQLFTQVYRYRIPSNTPPSSFNKLFYRIVQGLYMKIHNRIPCSLNKVSFKMDIPEPDELQIRIVGMALALKESEKALESVSTSCSSFSELSDDLILSLNIEKDLEPLDALSSYTPRKQISKKRNEVVDNEIHISSLSYIPGASINLYLGNLNFVFIRESTMVKEQTGGVNNFVNSLLSDVTSIVKSHAAGIGGNAVVNFFVNECLLSTHSHKNQGQCLINVGGDVVRYSPKTHRLDV